jgi:NAD(P)-dependent dehydrogenase (short-subunit alcohol dehydrogenase family)
MTQSKLIVITGGGGGIGRATALLCARRSDQVAVLDKNGDSAQQTAEAARAEGASAAIGIPCDVSDEGQVEHAFTKIHEQFGTPYGIFANAGIDMGGLIHEMPLERWQRILDINLTGIFLTCKYGLRLMLAEQISGSIV